MLDRHPTAAPEAPRDVAPGRITDRLAHPTAWRLFPPNSTSKQRQGHQKRRSPVNRTALSEEPFDAQLKETSGGGGAEPNSASKVERGVRRGRSNCQKRPPVAADCSGVRLTSGAGPARRCDKRGAVKPACCGAHPWFIVRRAPQRARTIRGFLTEGCFVSKRSNGAPCAISQQNRQRISGRLQGAEVGQPPASNHNQRLRNRSMCAEGQKEDCQGLKTLSRGAERVLLAHRRKTGRGRASAGKPAPTPLAEGSRQADGLPRDHQGSDAPGPWTRTRELTWSSSMPQETADPDRLVGYTLSATALEEGGLGLFGRPVGNRWRCRAAGEHVSGPGRGFRQRTLWTQASRQRHGRL